MTAADDAYRAAEAAIARVEAHTELDLSGPLYHELESLPPSIDDIEVLETLYLTGTRVTDLSRVGGCVDLRTLSIGGDQIVDLAPLSGLVSLDVLSVSGTGVSDLQPLRDLTGLSGLYISSTPAADLTPLAGLTGLQMLSLNRTRITDLTPLRGLINLGELYCGQNQIDDISPLEGLAYLRRLSLCQSRVADLRPLRSLVNLLWLDLDETPVADLAPLQGLVKLQGLSLRCTPAADLRPIRGSTSLIEHAPSHAGRGLQIAGCAAARNDPEGLGRLAEIPDSTERTRAILDYLNALPEDWTPPSDPIERAMSGPILEVSLADIELSDRHFIAVSPDKPLPAERGRDFHELVSTLVWAAIQIAASRQIIELGPSVAGDFETYRTDLLVEQPNGRLLNYTADSIRGVLSDDYLSGALDGQMHARIASFLQLHDDLMRIWFPAVQQIVILEPELSAGEIIHALPVKLEAAETQVQYGINLGVFSASVQEPIGRLKDRFRSARLALANASDVAVNELRRIVTLTTAWLGRIKGRLLQYVISTTVYHREDPARASAEATLAIASVQKVLSAIGPLFDDLWRWINSLPLPF